MQVIFADSAQDDLASVDSYTNFWCGASFQPQSVGIFAHLFLHPQGSVHSPLRMIFMSDGHTKESKDAIAGGLGHEAFVAMHGIHHKLQGRIDDGAGLFGIKILHEGHRAFDIGKEGSDGLALALRRTSGLQRLPLGQDTLSEMFRSVGDRSRVRSLKSGARSRFPFSPFAFFPFPSGPSRKQGATFTTELKSQRILEATLRAAAAELRAALAAELHPGGIFKVAMWTLHVSPPPLPAPPAFAATSPSFPSLHSAHEDQLPLRIAPVRQQPSASHLLHQSGPSPARAPTGHHVHRSRKRRGRYGRRASLPDAYALYAGVLDSRLLDSRYW